MIHNITDDNFDVEVANCEKPCIIFFTAGFCTYCDDMYPRFELLAEKYADTCKFCLVNIDEQRKLRIKFVVACTPYIVMVKDRMVTPLFDMIVSTEQLDERISYAVNGGECPVCRPLR